MRMTFIQNLAVGLLCAAMLMTTIRLIKGPSSADRIVALDLLAVIIVALISTISVIFNETVYLDIATSLAVIAFVGTVAYSRFLLQKEKYAQSNKVKNLE